MDMRHELRSLSPATLKKLHKQWEQERGRAEMERSRGTRERLTEKLNAIHERLLERAALGLLGPIDPLNKRPPLPPQVPSPWAKPGYEYPRGWGPEGRLAALPPPGPRVREL